MPLPDEVVASTRPLATRPFVPGQDEAAWVETNNRAFGGHPEQGAWTVEQLRDRMAADWVELDGFLLADDPDGPGLIGSCWTKIHRDRAPVLGEIYVISVDPRHHGEGWGRSLTVAGPRMAGTAGVTNGMLYTDATNEAAVSLYRSLGFTVDHVDRSYRRATGGVGTPPHAERRSAHPGPDRLADPEGDRGGDRGHRELAQRGHHDRALGVAGQHDAHDEGGHGTEHHRQHDGHRARREQPGRERDERADART